MKVKSDHGSKLSNLSNLKEEAWKKISASSGFEPVTSAIPVRCSTLYQLSYEATHWERGQFIELIFPRAVKWCEVYVNKLASLPMCGFIAEESMLQQKKVILHKVISIKVVG